jgi:ABC-2 type transport system permease protein
MLRHLTAITRKELKILFKDPAGLALLFLMPLFFIIAMSLALQGVFDAGGKKRPVTLLIVDLDQGVLSKKVVSDLAGVEGILLKDQVDRKPLTLEKAESLINKKVYPLALVFNNGFSKEVEAGQSIDETVYLIMGPSINQQLTLPLKGVIRGVLERLVLSKKIEGLWSFLGKEKSLGLPPPPVGGFTMVLKTVPPRGKQARPLPSAVEQSVPAYTIFGVFFILVTLANGFYKEKIEGTFARIMTTPISPTVFLLGKLIPYYLVNLMQIALMFAVGFIFFGMMPGNIPALILLSLCLAFSANGLGLLVASLGKTETQINGLGVLLAVTLAAMGGMMVPTFVMPPLMKTLAFFTPHAWALAGYHDILLSGLGVQAVWPESLVLLSFAASFFLLSLWRLPLKIDR